jgi:hypothetical protein
MLTALQDVGTQLLPLNAGHLKHLEISLHAKEISPVLACSNLEKLSLCLYEEAKIDFSMLTKLHTLKITSKQHVTNPLKIKFPKSLRSFSIENHVLDSTSVDILPLLPLLETLEIGKYCIRDTDMENILGRVKLTSLKMHTVMSTPLTYSCMKNLTSLDITFNCEYYQVLQDLQNHPLPYLKSLSIMFESNYNTKFDDDCEDLILELIHDQPYLESLSLKRMVVAWYPMSMIAKLPSLNSLKLIHCAGISQDSVLYLALNETITELSIEHVNLKNDVLRSLPLNHTITKLSLFGCNHISNQLVPVIQMKSLQCIDLVGIELEPDAVRAIAESESLTELDLFVDKLPMKHLDTILKMPNLTRIKTVGQMQDMNGNGKNDNYYYYYYSDHSDDADY